MAKKKAVKVRHIPQRTCVGCRKVLPKKGLIRLVRTPEGITIDPGGKAPGRGAYLHELKMCWEKGLKGSIASALKTELTEKDRIFLKSYMTDFPEDSAADANVPDVDT